MIGFHYVQCVVDRARSVGRDSRYFFCGSSNFSPFLNTA